MHLTRKVRSKYMQRTHGGQNAVNERRFQARQSKHQCREYWESAIASQVEGENGYLSQRKSLIGGATQ